MTYKCPRIEIEPTIFSGCKNGDDCPVCGGSNDIIRCPVCGEKVLTEGICRNGCWYPLISQAGNVIR